jgi:hypothetical protein
MRWKTKHRPECYPGVEAEAKPQERLVRLLLIAVIAILSVLSLIYVSHARAHGTLLTDLAWTQKAYGSATAPNR